MKYKQIRDPTNLKELRSILGALQYYCCYIPHMSEISKPLTNLTRKDMPFRWTSDLSGIVHQLLTSLETAVLQLAPTGKIFRLETDASNVAIGGVLYDKELYGKRSPEHNCLPIMFMSHSLDMTQRNWNTNERELYALMWCLEKCKNIVQGREIYIYTDYQNLPSILKNNMTPKVE